MSIATRRFKEVEVRSNAEGCIFNIQRYSVHDGPGIRTIVFMSGCPLRCLWCANPESFLPHPIVGFIRTICAGCGRCVEVCPNHANKIAPDGKSELDWQVCQNCGECTKVCPTGARKKMGRWMSVEEVVHEVERDWPFYVNSHGGVTFSGGEPCAQPRFLVAALRECKKRGLHVVMETCGCADTHVFREALGFIDFLYFDIKVFNSQKHVELTGKLNELILHNFREAVRLLQGNPIVVRTPIVPNYTAGSENVANIAEFVSGLKSSDDNLQMELMPYHDLGAAKYEQYGMEYKLNDVGPPTEEEIGVLKRIVESARLRCLVSGR